MRVCLSRQQELAANGDKAFQWTLARVGGDEFVILLDGELGTDESAEVAGALHEQLRTPVIVEGRSIHISVSIGIAQFASGYAEVDQLLRDADLAMYHAKTAGRGRTVVFRDSIGIEVRNAHALEQELREAIQRREFLLHYQPIVSFSDSDDIKGFEALLRWNHPTRGQLTPDTFIDVAEQTGLILLIGDWVLREACSTASAWHKRDAERAPFISINISPKQFLQPEFAQRVMSILLETQIDPTAVRLEVTEGVAIIDAERTAQVIGEIRSWGVKTSLDDFGTGFSSLSYLQTLPFDAIKIDRSFITAMNGSEQGEGIVRAILELARTMDMTVVAEGVETTDQQRKLTELGCQFGQGYHFGRPVDSATVTALLQTSVAP
jgi:predicted signal transduction protein with EAL and GGDEF domain